jgi:hypothetical protein
MAADMVGLESVSASPSCGRVAGPLVARARRTALELTVRLYSGAVAAFCLMTLLITVRVNHMVMDWPLPDLP